jgi:ubiquinone/menaquinone biosynthesis C-methylase UbiE
MGSRGEASFARLPGFAAALYERLTETGGIVRQQREIAQWVAGRVPAVGRLLDVGCGPGGLLAALHREAPGLALHGLDIAEAMVERARRRLAGTGVEVRRGTARATGFDGAFFDAVVSTGSFYLWDEPAECLDEIFRILKPGGTAWLFESCVECDREAVRRAVETNLRGEGLLRRNLAPRFISKQLGMTYTAAEMEALALRSRFGAGARVERVTLAGVPAFARMELEKAATAG